MFSSETSKKKQLHNFKWRFCFSVESFILYVLHFLPNLKTTKWFYSVYRNWKGPTQRKKI